MAVPCVRPSGVEMMTVAPETSVPLASDTVPVNLPEVSCDRAGVFDITSGSKVFFVATAGLALTVDSTIGGLLTGMAAARP